MSKCHIVGNHISRLKWFHSPSYGVCTVFRSVFDFQACVQMLVTSTKRVAQSVMCLTTDACLTADPGIASSILGQSHTFVEIGHDIISKAFLLIPR